MSWRSNTTETQRRVPCCSTRTCATVGGKGPGVVSTNRNRITGVGDITRASDELVLKFFKPSRASNAL